jgi:choline dehydrogenase-like flavoprotein
VAARNRIEADVCVIGAGPAGIAFARSWIGAASRVVLLESGRFVRDPAADDLARGSTVSVHQLPGSIAHGRRRQFGGTANLWLYGSQPSDGRAYARSLPPEPIDLEPSAAREAAWPIGMEELERWLPAAQATWNGAPYDYRPASWGGATMPLVEGTVLRSAVVQHGPADVFTTRYRDDLLAAPNIEVLLGHTALALDADSGGDRIRAARVVDGDGRLVEVHAREFVLAAGGIENVQLLLHSAPTRPGGPGNRHDVVGRFITDHPEFRMAALEPATPAVFDRLDFYDLRWFGRHLVAGMVTLDPELKRAEGLLNSSVALVPQPRAFGSPANRSLATLLAAFPGEWPSPMSQHLRALAGSPVSAVRTVRMRRRPWHEFAGGWSNPGRHREAFDVIEAYAATEQSPSRSNRVVLDTERDALGRCRPRLEWTWSRADRANVERSIERYGDALEAAGLGRFRRWAELEGPGRPRFSGIHHPMGGTRMDPDPSRGVVDDQCAVHGISNLSIVGSSVFPTGLGYANPTLTILALAVRLAAQLRERLGETSARAGDPETNRVPDRQVAVLTG